MHYFTVTNPGAFDEAQQVAVSGYAGLKAFLDAANQAQRTDPVPGRQDLTGYQSARWNAAVPESMRYHPATNPKGARPTIFDAARNVYGVNPETGFALRPFDNVGVQYGLKALNAGAITVAQFLDLNERIGGVDHDSNYVARADGRRRERDQARLPGRPHAWRRRRAGEHPDLRQRDVDRGCPLPLRLVPLCAARAAAPGQRQAPTTW